MVARDIKKVGLTNKVSDVMLMAPGSEYLMTKKVNIYEAKKNLSGLVDEVVNDGEDVVICKYGHPMVRLVPISQENIRPQIGFAEDYLTSINFHLPEDFDTMLQDEIQELFEGDEV